MSITEISEIKNLIILSDSLNPYHHLAVEHYLISRKTNHVLYLYRNRKCVSIGRNQNPWMEVNPDFLKSHDIILVRRFSGGGAVYMDEGVAAFSFIGSEPAFNTERQLGFILDMFKKYGLKVEISNGRSIYIDDKKISGNAFYIKLPIKLHHGTILINADLNKLKTALQPGGINIQTHAIRSEPAPVVNLISFDQQVSYEKLISEIIASAQAQFGLREVTDESSLNIPQDILQKEADKFSSFNWILGTTPAFSIENEFYEPRLWKSFQDIPEKLPDIYIE